MYYLTSATVNYELFKFLIQIFLKSQHYLIPSDVKYQTSYFLFLQIPDWLHSVADNALT